MHYPTEYENSLDVICDAVELLRKRKLRADDDRIQTVLKHRRWTDKYFKDRINDAAREGRICKLMYKDNFGYRTAARISDKMAMRIVPFEPEHPDEIPKNVYSLVMKAMKALPDAITDGVNEDFLLDHLKADKKLLNYNLAGLKMVLCGLQKQNEIIQLKSTLKYVIRTLENENDAAPVPDVIAKANTNNTSLNVDEDTNSMRTHSSIADEEKIEPSRESLAQPENSAQRLAEIHAAFARTLEEISTDSSTSSSDSSDDLESLSYLHSLDRIIPQDIAEPQVNNSGINENEDSSSGSDDESVGGDPNDSTEAVDGDDKEEEKTDVQEEEPSEPAVNEPVSSAAGRRRRVNPRYINDFYLTSSSTKGGRGVKEDYAAIARKLKLKSRGKKCADCGGPISEIGVCIKCLFPNDTKTTRRKGYKRKVVTPPTEEPVVKSGKLARHARSVRRSGATTKSAHLNVDTKGLSSGSRRVTVDSNDTIDEDTFDETKLSIGKTLDGDDSNDMEDTTNRIEDNKRRPSQETPPSTGEQAACSISKDDHKSKPKSKHNKDGSYKTCYNGLVTDKQQKPQIPLRFIPNRKRPEPDRSSSSNTASSNLYKKTCLDLDNNIDDATATSILDIPTKQLAATANENNHSTNGIFVPSSTR